LDSLIEQFEFEVERHNIEPKSLETLFIGGGTPSTIDASLYMELFDKIGRYLKVGAEITVEANPHSATEQWLSQIYSLGANRVSLGVQSFSDIKLNKLGREHTRADAFRAVEAAKKSGFDSINIDLIYAHCDDTQELLLQDLQSAFSLPIDHISAYALTIESGTLFAKRPEVASEDLELTKTLFEEIKKGGFEQYEISNFAQTRSKHNLGYWQYRPYIGLGAGAVGSIEQVRYYPHSSIELYIKNPLYRREEKLSSEDVKSEKLLLALRSCVGVDRALLNTQELQRAQWLCEEGRLKDQDGRFYNRDYLLSDEITLYIQGN